LLWGNLEIKEEMAYQNRNDLMVRTRKIVLKGKEKGKREVRVYYLCLFGGELSGEVSGELSDC